LNAGGSRKALRKEGVKEMKCVDSAECGTEQWMGRRIVGLRARGRKWSKRART
jgi:hypothetical protein